MVRRTYNVTPMKRCITVVAARLLRNRRTKVCLEGGRFHLHPTLVVSSPLQPGPTAARLIIIENAKLFRGAGLHSRETMGLIDYATYHQKLKPWENAMKSLITLEQMRGVFAVLPTPSTDRPPSPMRRSSVDLAETERATRALHCQNVGDVANGSLGEMATLSYEEWKVSIRWWFGTAKGAKPDLPVRQRHHARHPQYDLARP